jgi:tetratricopeptide (TPR) repeat protein
MKKILFAILLLVTGVATTGIYHLTQQADICYYKGRDLFVKAKYKDSIPFFRESLVHDPKRPETLSKLGYAYLWSGNYPQAIEVFQKLVSSEPKAPRAKKTLANVYSWNKEYAKAEAIFLEILRTDPNDREAQKELAEIYIWDNKFDLSKAILVALLRNNPGDARAKLLYGKALLYSGQTKEAIRIFEELSKVPKPIAKESL